MIELKIKNKFLYSKYVFIIFLFVGLFPAVNIRFVFPIQYFFTPILLIYILLNIKLKFDKNIIIVFSLLIFLTLYILLNGLIIGSFKTGNFSIHMDFVPYLIKTIVFIAVFYFVYNNKTISERELVKYFLLFGFFASLISLLQWMPNFTSKYLVEIYSYKEKTIEFAMRSTLWNKRVPGFAFHPTASGGFSAFIFPFAFYSLFYLRSNKIISIFTLLLCLLNTTIFAQARMGFLTIAFELVLIILFNLKTYKGIRNNIYGLIVFFIVFYILFEAFNIKDSAYYEQFLSRWQSLREQVNAGGNRIGQVMFGLNKLETPLDFIFGISRPYQNTFHKFLIEVEPFYIFVIYGLVGVFFAYFPLYIIYRYTIKLLKSIDSNNKDLKTLLLLLRIIVPSYLFFSLAYYFYRENYIGLIPWIFYASVLGIAKRKQS